MTSTPTSPTTPATPTGEQPAPTRDIAARDVILKCVGLTKIFRDFWLRNRVKAVDAIDLEVARGEVFGLLGPNGSGKSTTIKMILGLLHPTAGRIAVFGHHPRDVAIKEKIGYLPEESYLYRFLNARETLEYYGRLFHQGRRQRRQRIDMLLEMVGLDRVAHRPVGEYSKGMQRRIGLAQALINDPQLLILDEPTTGLDPIGTRQIKDLIVELAGRGKTVLLCSHLLADVEDVCDRVSIMYGGKVRRHGTVDELLVQSDFTDIQAADLTPQDIEVVEQLLESRGKHIDRVDRPRQRLEKLFLDIVHAAQSEGLATSGAGSGGRIAEFLTGSDEDADPDRVIQELVGDEQTEDADESASAPDKQSAEPSAPPSQAVQDTPNESDVIHQLVGDDAAAPQDADGGTSTDQREADPRSDSPSPAAQTSTPPSSDEQVDESVLDSLMGNEPQSDEQTDEQRKDDQREK